MSTMSTSFQVFINVVLYKTQNHIPVLIVLTLSPPYQNQKLIMDGVRGLVLGIA